MAGCRSSRYFLSAHLPCFEDILCANGIIPAPEPVNSGQKRKPDNTDTVPAVRAKREKTATTSTKVKPEPESEEIHLLEVSPNLSFIRIPLTALLCNRRDCQLYAQKKFVI
jgi:hypothetical protein